MPVLNTYHIRNSQRKQKQVLYATQTQEQAAEGQGCGQPVRDAVDADGRAEESGGQDPVVTVQRQQLQRGRHSHAPRVQGRYRYV